MSRELSRNVERNYGQKFVPKTKFRGNIVRYFERSNEKSLLRKFAAIKRNFSDIQL